VAAKIRGTSLPSPLALMMRSADDHPRRRMLAVDSPNLLYAALARLVTHVFITGLQIPTSGASRPWSTHAVVIESIEAIVDPAASARYRRQIAITKAAHEDRSIHWPGPNERLAFRGTPYSLAAAVVRGGFRSIFNTQSAYGSGTYFSMHASYSDHYAAADGATGRQAMFVSRILVNGYKSTSQGDLLPGWHANGRNGAWLAADASRGLGAFPCVVGANSSHDPDIFVCAEDALIEPQFLIIYRRVPR
jgi:hypothetical protein